MKYTTMLVLLLAVAPVSQPRSAEPASQVIEFTTEVTGSIDLAKDGSVQAYRFDKGPSPAVLRLLEKNIVDWRFEPVTVEGRPVLATTRMRIGLEAWTTADGIRMAMLRSVSFGGPASSRFKAPHYPMAAADAGLEARVVLVIEVDSSGKVLRVHPEQTSLRARGEGPKAEAWRRVFEKPSIAAAKKWRFRMTDYVDGTVQGASVRIPIEFMLGSGHQRSGAWKGYVSGPIHPIPWHDDTRTAQDAPLEAGEVQPLDQLFKLKSDVVGTVL